MFVNEQKCIQVKKVHYSYVFTCQLSVRIKIVSKLFNCTQFELITILYKYK